jgi:hypothetical protein
MEANNMAAMREALLKALTALKVCEWEEGTDMDGVKSIISEIESALSAQPRNCDVGTAEEQEKRFDDWVCDRRGDLNCTGKCPAHNGVDFGVVNCVLQWAQMPYEKGGAL